MRIISGFLKGKKIKFLKNSNTRPLKDSVKENIFNILIHSKFIKAKIEKSNVLDLYSGIGSFGIECISRGAEKVIFIEKDISALNTLKENLKFLSIIDKTKLINGKIEDKLAHKFENKFDIFFLDPPFADSDFINNLKKLKDAKLFNRDHIVIIHREKKTFDNFGNLLKIIETKAYGRSKIIFGSFS